MGGGGAFLDYNRDGRLDIFLVNSGCHKFSVKCAPGKNALYRQNADGTFTDVAQQAGVASSGIYGMGVVVGDYDNDGYPDIYVTGFPHNTLYHNNGDGTFTDVTDNAGVAASGWSTSAAFFDYNRDGWMDLYVANDAVRIFFSATMATAPSQRWLCSPRWPTASRGNRNPAWVRMPPTTMAMAGRTCSSPTSTTSPTICTATAATRHSPTSLLATTWARWPCCSARSGRASLTTITTAPSIWSC